MKKAICIIGNKETGKSYLADRISAAYEPGEIVRIAGNVLRPSIIDDRYFWSMCTSKTTLVIIDDIDKAIKLSWFANAITDGILVDRKYKTPFWIYPTIILIGTIPMKDIEKLGLFVRNRLEIIDTAFIGAKNTVIKK